MSVKKINHETDQSVSIVFDIPESLKFKYKFKAGQYITIKTVIDSEEVVRSYSICSAPSSGKLKIGVKAIPNGIFSNHAVHNLMIGDVMEVSPPTGRFTVKDPHLENVLMGIAAGSGITPILSIIHDTLESNQDSKFILLYGNKSKNKTNY